jgi:hypothetical protein
MDGTMNLVITITIREILHALPPCPALGLLLTPIETQNLTAITRISKMTFLINTLTNLNFKESMRKPKNLNEKLKESPECKNYSKDLIFITAMKK